jgi:hypothetical protein
VGGVVAGVSAVNGVGRKPETGRDHFRHQPGVIQFLFDILGFAADLRRRFAVNVGHHVVIVEHHGIEAEFLHGRELPVKGLGRAGGRSVGIGAFADIPRSETKFVILCHKCRSRYQLLKKWKQEIEGRVGSAKRI